MKSVTVKLDEGVAQCLTDCATRENITVSRLVGQILRAKMVEEEGYEVAMQQFLSQQPLRLKRSGGYVSREQLHQRLRPR